MGTAALVTVLSGVFYAIAYVALVKFARAPRAMSRWLVPVVAVVFPPVYYIAIVIDEGVKERIHSWPWPGILVWIVGPSTVLALTVWTAGRTRVPAAGLALAGVIATVVVVGFDNIPHGQWYHTGDSNVTALSLLGAPAWLLVAGGTLVSWAVRTRRATSGTGPCTTCRYDLAGLSPGAVCPECGTAPPAAPPHSGHTAPAASPARS